MKSAVALLSGGLDSTTLAYYLKFWLGVEDLHLLSFNYGQRHKKELDYARITARKLEAPHHVVELGCLQDLITGSALTSTDIPVPEGHYTAESMKATVVPNRNMIMLAIAAGYAVSRSLQFIATAVHAGDHAIYPDCRPEFITQLGAAILTGNDGFGAPALIAPFVNYPKESIVRQGQEVEVPWSDTWSCYKGQAVHCGKCGTCVERREAFQLAGVIDPTLYGEPIESPTQYGEPRYPNPDV